MQIILRFFSKFRNNALKITNINKHVIKFLKNKLLFYCWIDSLGQIKLETLKIYIKTYLKTETL